MTCLEEIRSSAERLVTAASDALRLEMAIFDSDSNLFYCTPTYLKKKRAYRTYPLHPGGFREREHPGYRSGKYARMHRLPF